MSAIDSDPILTTPMLELSDTVDEVEENAEVVFDIDGLSVSYGDKLALRDVSMKVRKNQVTAFIGPSGCGKSTLIRCLNRMNDGIATLDGTILYHGQDMYEQGIDVTDVRRRIGMVFQRPNPFPKSIYDNVAYGPRVQGMKGDMKERVERTLKHVALWDEVHDRLKASATGLSGGQQQRLCIARAIAVGPEVVLLDEPCSALDPISTGKIEELIHELKTDYTVVIVTHNMQQAARSSDFTAYMYLGDLIEFGRTQDVFMRPTKKDTEDYITGRFG